MYRILLVNVAEPYLCLVCGAQRISHPLVFLTSTHEAISLLLVHIHSGTKTQANRSPRVSYRHTWRAVFSDLKRTNKTGTGKRRDRVEWEAKMEKEMVRRKKDVNFQRFWDQSGSFSDFSPMKNLTLVDTCGFSWRKGYGNLDPLYEYGGVKRAN